MSNPTDAPVQLTSEQRLEIAERMATCPFIGAAVATGDLQVRNTADNPLASIDDVAALGDTGGGSLGSRVLRLFARGNHSTFPGTNEAVPEGTFSLAFGGSQGAHHGHSGILLGDPTEVGRGRLDEAAFERLAQLADAEGRLSIDVVGDFIADNLNRDPKSDVLPGRKFLTDIWQLLRETSQIVTRGGAQEKTEAIAAFTKLLGTDHLVGSAGEWGLLFAFLKNSPNSADGDIALADVRMMFIDKRLPDGWETWEKSALDWIQATARLAKDAAFAYHLGKK